MKVRVIFVGKTDEGWLSEGCEKYTRRIRHYLPFSLEIIPDIRNTRNMPPEMLRKKEAEKILSSLGPDDRLILLDEKGKQFESGSFAGFIGKEGVSGTRSLVFLVAGAYGADPAIKEKADVIMSLSKMTFPHQLVRVIFLEQLYRALSINKGEKYHNQ